MEVCLPMVAKGKVIVKVALIIMILYCRSEDSPSYRN